MCMIYNPQRRTYHNKQQREKILRTHFSCPQMVTLYFMAMKVWEQGNEKKGYNRIIYLPISSGPLVDPSGADGANPQGAEKTAWSALLTFPWHHCDAGWFLQSRITAFRKRRSSLFSVKAQRSLLLHFFFVLIQAGPELGNSPASTSWVLTWQMCVTCMAQLLMWNKYSEYLLQ